MRRPIGIAIIGTGDVASRWHAPAVARIPDARLVAVMSQTPGRGEAFACEHNVPRVYQTIEGVCDDPSVELAIIASRDGQHASRARRLLESGKHVLIEKPMVREKDDLQLLEQAMRASRNVLAVGYHLRHHPAHQRILEEIRAGTLGALTKIQITWAYNDPNPQAWRLYRDSTAADWWAMGALGTHCLDLVRMFTGMKADELEIVSFKVHNRQHGGRDEEAGLTFTLPTGTKVIIFVSVIARHPRQVMVWGTQGSMYALETLGPRGEGDLFLNEHPLEFPRGSPYEAQLRNDLRAIRAEGAPLVGFEDGRENVEFLRVLSRHLNTKRSQS